jgi:hypothetical protein
MHATQREDADPSLIVAENHKIFAQQAAANRPALELAAEADRVPVSAHHFAARRARPNAGQLLIFVNA